MATSIRKLQTVVCCIVVGSVLAFSGCSTGDSDLQAKAEEAMRLAAEGDYKSALTLYEDIANTGHSSAALFANQAELYLETDEIGKALASLIKAQRIRPDRLDLKEKLKLVRTIQTKRSIVKAEPTSRTLHAMLGVKESISPIGLELLALCFYLLGWGLLLSQFHRIAWSLASAGVACVFAGLFLISVQKFVHHGWHGQPYWGTVAPTLAIVNQDATALYSGSDANQQVILLLNSGTELLVNSRDGNMVWVGVADGRIGWVKPENVEIVD